MWVCASQGSASCLRPPLPPRVCCPTYCARGCHVYGILGQRRSSVRIRPSPRPRACRIQGVLATTSVRGNPTK
eukprot:4636363-Lingulodinium_polyedra.AAC.1